MSYFGRDIFLLTKILAALSIKAWSIWCKKSPAKPGFQYKLESGSSLDQNKAYWYLAMVYLKAGEKERAINVLETLTEDPTRYKYKVAQELLEKLKEL